jgi:hypothetical protein
LQDLERGIHEFSNCLDSDQLIANYAASHRDQWRELRGYLVDTVWDTYYYRWKDLYKKRLSPVQWAIAGFALPPRYYKKVVSSAVDAGKYAALCQVQRYCPQAYAAYRTAKTRLRGDTNY